MIIRNAQVIPVKVYSVKNKSMAKDYTAMTSGTMTKEAMTRSSILKAQTFIEITENPIYDVLRNPNPNETWSTFIANYLGFGKLTGNRYIYGAKDGTKQIKEMYMLPSQQMEIISGGMFNPIAGYNLKQNDKNQIDFAREDICHIKDFNPVYDGSGSHLYGQAPLEAAYRVLEINNQGVETAMKLQANQAARGLLVAKEMNGIGREQAQQLDKSLQQKMSDNRGGLAITNQPMEWINFGLSPADLQLIEQNNANLKDLCNVFGVPVVLMNNTEGSTYNNIKEAKSQLFQNAVIPELVRLREDLNKWLAPAYGDDLYIDFDFTVIPELQEAVSEMVDQMDKAWYLTPNEKRKVLLYSEDTENELMNEYFVPANYLPMKNMDFQSLRTLERATRIDNNLKNPVKDDV